MARRQGPLEHLVRNELAKSAQYQLSGECELGILQNAYHDTAATREALNTRMGQLQRAIEERKQSKLAEAQDAAGDKYRFERETDPILRPDGQC